MAQVIVYENGNAIGGEGHPTYARDITFENTGTDLEAETAQAAIVEVNEKTKHGIVELWENESTSDFAGQTTNVATNREYDAFLISYGDTSNKTERGVILNEVGANGVFNYMDMGSNGNINSYQRSITVAKTTTGYSFTFTDCTVMTRTNAGSVSSNTRNGFNAPLRILGVIHES